MFRILSRISESRETLYGCEIYASVQYTLDAQNIKKLQPDFLGKFSHLGKF